MEKEKIYIEYNLCRIKYTCVFFKRLRIALGAILAYILDISFYNVMN